MYKPTLGVFNVVRYLTFNFVCHSQTNHFDFFDIRLSLWLNRETIRYFNKCVVFIDNSNFAISLLQNIQFKYGDVLWL